MNRAPNFRPGFRPGFRRVPSPGSSSSSSGPSRRRIRVDIDLADDSSDLSTESISSTAEGSFPRNDMLSQDILKYTFDFLEIETSDLLNFRSVCRNWRDAATTLLLERDACQIVLDERRLPLQYSSYTETGSDDDPEFKYYNARQPDVTLEDLTQLMSTSSNFPSASIRFLPGCASGLGNACDEDCDCAVNLNDRRHHQPDLVDFYHLHGRKIKTLCLGDKISPRELQNILIIHMPCLECLDLRFFENFSKEGRVFNERQSAVLQLKTLHIGPAFEDNTNGFLMQVCLFSPNLRAIKDVHVAALEVLIDAGKYHRIQDLHFDPDSAQLLRVQRLQDFLTGREGENAISTRIRPKLTKLVFQCTKIQRRIGAHLEFVTVLNSIIEENKNTLEILQFRVNPIDFLERIKIPPLPKLKSLRLAEDLEKHGNPLMLRVAFLTRLRAAQIARDTSMAHLLVYDRHIFHFQLPQGTNIPPAYFPRLRKVEFDVITKANVYNKTLGFFSTSYVRSSSNQEVVRCLGDSIETVNTLQLANFNSYEPCFSELFPFVRNLKVKCVHLSELKHSIWKVCPLVERMEIYGISDKRLAPAPLEYCNDNTNWVDSFFTGLSPDLCGALQRTSRPGVFVYENFSLRNINRIRTYPQMRDCQKLKEFKITFGAKLTKQFASRLTGIYGFNVMPTGTRIVFSFKSVCVRSRDLQSIKRYLEPIADYIKIQM